MLTMGKSLTKTTTIIAGAVLALSLTACGSESNDAGSGDKTTAPAASPTGDAGSTTAPSTGTGGVVPDDAWAAAFKKAIPPLKDTPDADIVAAGKKVCADFKASPTPETAKGIVKDTATNFKIDQMQANIFTGGVVAHFCNDQGDAFIKASIGG